MCFEQMLTKLGPYLATDLELTICHHWNVYEWNVWNFVVCPNNAGVDVIHLSPYGQDEYVVECRQSR